MTHILEVNKFYAPHIGGIETLVQQRAEYFAQQPDTEVRVLVCQDHRGRAEHKRINGAASIGAASLQEYYNKSMTDLGVNSSQTNNKVLSQNNYTIS